jgi:transposase InsO family protein
VHIQPGKPTQNAHVESFHGRLREECLTVSWFQNLFDARRKIASPKQCAITRFMNSFLSVRFECNISCAF